MEVSAMDHTDRVRGLFIPLRHAVHGHGTDIGAHRPSLEVNSLLVPGCVVENQIYIGHIQSNTLPAIHTHIHSINHNIQG